jgi:hypothetical protein
MLNGMQMIPLTVLAGELDETIDAAAALVGDALQTDAASGVKVVAAHLCRQLITTHHEQLQAQAQAQAAKAEAQRAQQERQAAQYAAQDRVREARARRQRQLLRDNPDMSALETMLATDANPDRRTPAGMAFDELYHGERRGEIGYGYRYTPTKE